MKYIKRWVTELINRHKQSGFTVVELLIVIVVIGILAAITMVSYNGIQGRARDTERKSEVLQIAEAIQLYNLDVGDFAEAGCGNGTGTGYIATDYDGVGPFRPIMTCLTDGKYLTRALVDPSGSLSCSGVTCFTYMKASCAAGTFVYAHLESLPQTTTDTDGTCQTTWDTGYGVNYVVQVE